MELSAGGVVGAVVAGGVVLCVVWLSVPPLSLHAARPSKAIAETDARMIFFIVLLLSKLARYPPSVTRIMATPYFRFLTLGYRLLQLRCVWAPARDFDRATSTLPARDFGFRDRIEKC
jgi:hypothetical protein